MSQQLDILLPEFTAAMNTGFQSVSASISAMHAQNDNLNRRVDESERNMGNIIADGFLRMAAQFALPTTPNPPASTSASVAAVPPPILSASAPDASLPTPSAVTYAQAAAATTVVQYKMKRELVKVTDVWREYDVGLSGEPAVRQLEEDFGTKWRTDRTESRFFNSRLVLYREVKKIVQKDEVSPAEAAEKLEIRRIEMKASIDKNSIHASGN